jgi:hypothetical protein
MGPIFKGQAVQETLKMGPIGCPETWVATNRRYVTSQKSEDRIYPAAEAWNHACTVCTWSCKLSTLYA